jgi:enamine deaminase RidA (YjgF/YER057c/UK114 family)
MESRVKYYPMYYGGVKQVYPNVLPGSPMYAQCIVVDNLLFVSGMTAQDVETGKIMVPDIAAQMNVALSKVEKALKEVGSSMDNVIKTLILLSNPDDYTLMRKTEFEYYQKHAPVLVEFPPVSTLCHAKKIGPGPEYLVEVEVVAVMKR